MEADKYPPLGSNTEDEITAEDSQGEKSDKPVGRERLPPSDGDKEKPEAYKGPVSGASALPGINETLRLGKGMLMDSVYLPFSLSPSHTTPKPQEMGLTRKSCLEEQEEKRVPLEKRKVRGIKLILEMLLQNAVEEIANKRMAEEVGTETVIEWEGTEEEVGTETVIEGEMTEEGGTVEYFTCSMLESRVSKVN